MHKLSTSIASNDDLHQVRMFELYNQLVCKWSRSDIAMPTFESWQHALQILYPGPRALHASMTDREIFSVIETFVIYLCKAKLALVLETPTHQASESNIGDCLASIFSLDEENTKRLQDLLAFYVTKTDK